jgi:hypothetical protein
MLQIRSTDVAFADPQLGIQRSLVLRPLQSFVLVRSGREYPDYGSDDRSGYRAGRAGHCAQCCTSDGARGSPSRFMQVSP